MSHENSLDPIAQHIGTRIRSKRKQFGWSQRGLADRVGLTFQQIQKYESGANKVSSPTLYHLARTLEVPVGYFYEGLDNPSDDLYLRVAQTPEGGEMMRSFIEIKNPAARTSLVSMAKTLAGSQGPTSATAP